MDTVKHNADAEKTQRERTERVEVESESDHEEHLQCVADYMSQLLESHGSSANAFSVDDNSAESPASQDDDAGDKPDTTAVHPVMTVSASSTSDLDVIERRQPSKAPETRELFSKMRSLANDSTSSALELHSTKFRLESLSQIGYSAALLGTACVLIELSTHGNTGLFVFGITAWLTAVVVSVPIFRRLKESLSHTSRSTTARDVISGAGCGEESA